MSQPLVLGYWKIRGLAQAIRLLLHYCGEEYVEDSYEFGGPPDFSGEAWFKCKFNKGLYFPNSNAIMEYVADKNGMLPNSAKERAVLHMLQGELTDFRANLRLLIFNPDFENLKQGYLDGLPVKLQAWSDYLGDKLWLTGEMINYPDFKLYDLLDTLRALESNCLDKFPNLKNYMNRFEALEPIKQFQNSDAYMARPFFGPKASWKHGNA
ncbi:Glutathione S-transferase Mu 4 [Sparganum proliferum]